jgi:hypothetical protein
VDPQVYLNFLRESGVEVSDEEFQFIRSETKRYLAKSGPTPNKRLATADWLYGELREHRKQQDPTRKIFCPVFFLTAGDLDHPQRTFYKEYCRLLLRSISPSLEMQEVPGQPKSFTWMYDELLKPEPAYRILVGPWKITAREASDLRFVPIPGWAHRLALLAPEGTKITRDDVFAFAGRRQNRQMRLMVIRREAGDLFLRGLAGLEGSNTLRRVEDHDLYAVAREFAVMLDDRPEHSALVIGEYEARTVIRILREVHGREVEDLADRPGARSPRWPVSLAVAASDVQFAALLRKATKELIRSVPDLAAGVYADYIAALVAESLNALPDRAAREEFLRHTFMDKKRRRIPGYFEVSSFDFWIPQEFRVSIREELRERLKDPACGVQAALPDDPRAVGKMTRRMVPPLPYERIQQHLRRIERKLLGGKAQGEGA